MTERERERERSLTSREKAADVLLDKKGSSDGY